MGRKKILVLDDEEMILQLTQDIFELLDFDCKVASDGPEAVELFRKAQERDEPFDIVLLDLTLPGPMDGVAVLKALRSIDPGIKAIVSSGYSDENVMARFWEYGFQAAVPKPYTIEVLKEAVYSALDQG